MSLQGITSSILYSTMPEAMLRDEIFPNKYHELHALSPVKSLSDLIDYTFKSVALTLDSALWIPRALVMIFVAPMIHLVKTRQEGEKTGADWGKIFLYHTMTTLVRPIIISLGYLFSGIRAGFEDKKFEENINLLLTGLMTELNTHCHELRSSVEIYETSARLIAQGANDEIKELNDEVKELKEMNKSLNRIITDLEGREEQKIVEIRLANETIQELQNKVLRLEKDLSQRKIKGTTGSIRDQLKAANRSNAKLSNENSELWAKVKELNDQLQAATA